MTKLPYNQGFIVNPQVQTYYSPSVTAPQLQQPQQTPVRPWNQAVTPVIRTYFLPQPAKKQGYTNLQNFRVPFLNTEGRHYKLDNGQEVVIIPKKGPTTIKTFVKVGSFNEQKHRGISHYIEHNLFNGSQGLAPKEFVEKVTGMGGIYNASTDTADTDYFIKSPLHQPGDFDKLLTMHANMLNYPTFTEKMLQKEKGPVISEIQMYEDDPYDKAYNTMVKNLFGIKADYQGLIAGSSRIIQDLTRKDVVNYYNDWYTPDNMVTVIVGDIDPDRTINIASRLFNRKKAAPQANNRPEYHEPLNLTTKPVRKDITSPHTDAASAFIGLAGPPNNDIRSTAASMALMIALIGYENARLTKALKPYNSTPTAEISELSSRQDAPQLITIGANFTPGQEEQGLKTIYSELGGLATNPVNQQELSLVKNKMLDSLSSISENSMTVADMVGGALTARGNLGAYTNIENTINSLTPQDIQNAAAQYLNLNRASLVVLHPESTNSGKKISFGSSNNRFKLGHIREYNFPNNLRVAINDDPAAIRTSAVLKIKSDRVTTLKPGVSDVLTRMLTKGTRNYSEEQFNGIVDAYNLGLQTEADPRSINISTDCRPQMLPLAAHMMKEMLYNPDFTREKLEKAKQEVRLEYSGVIKSPVDRALETLYPDHPFGLTSRKALENIDNITLDDVNNLHQHIIRDSKGIMTVDGPISATPGLGQSLFHELQAGMGFNKPYHPDTAPYSAPLEQNTVIAEAEERNQADVAMMFKVKESRNIKDHAALLLLNEILGGNSMSRLFSDLRETQKLAYRVNSNYVSDGEHGAFALFIKTTTEDNLKGPSYDNLKKSIDGFRGHINRLMTEPVSKKELENAKLQAKTSISNTLETSRGRSNLLMSGYETLYGAQHANLLVDEMEKLTTKDIQNAAKVYLGQPSVTSVIASENTLTNMKPYLESLGEFKRV